MNEKSFALICSHNGEKYIKRQLDSIYLANKEIEILVFDFNSNDNTLQICSDLSREMNLTIYSYPFSPGAKDSFMFALSVFKDQYHFKYEDYLLFISDQDDVWKRHKFHKVANFHGRIDRSKPQLVHHNVDLIDHNDNLISRKFYDYSESIIKKRYVTLYFSVVIGHTISLNKKFIELMNSFDVEDIIMHDWWLSIVADVNDCRYYLEEELSEYRIHTDNLYGLNLSGYNLWKKLKNYIRNCRAINRQRTSICLDNEDREQFVCVLKLLVRNKRFKLLALLLGQKILEMYE
jgi:glycosyltransferase involved in cell wall biosynthesis